MKSALAILAVGLYAVLALAGAATDLLDTAWSAAVLATVSAAVDRQTNTRESMASPLSSAAGTGRVRPGATTPGYKRLAQA